MIKQIEQSVLNLIQEFARIGIITVVLFTSYVN